MLPDDTLRARIEGTNPHSAKSALQAVGILIRDAENARQHSIGIPLLERTIARALERGRR